MTLPFVWVRMIDAWGSNALGLSGSRALSAPQSSSWRFDLKLKVSSEVAWVCLHAVAQLVYKLQGPHLVPSSILPLS